MHDNGTMELAAASTDIEAARELAESLKGTVYIDEREGVEHLPFRALVTASTDDLSALSSVGDAGVYLIHRRLKKAGVPKVVALFPMIRFPALSHAEADAHWRDVHGPLALEHHKFMTHYTQLSVVATLSGPELDGFALVGFDSLDDLRNRFFSGPGSEEAIAADVVQFADMKNSPARLIAEETCFS
jgi:uncharacterized protein (TIGR02118 family)